MTVPPIKTGILISLLAIASGIGYCQDQRSRKITVKKGYQVSLSDTVFIAKSDTVIILSEKDAKRVKIKENPYNKSYKFYDSLEEKASNNKIAESIFDFVVREGGGEKEKVVSKALKSEQIFEPYAGYTIGNILYKHVDPLEGSVIDTLRKATTKAAKLVNDLHVDTRPKIIAQNLIFKEGDKVDPYRLADNERVLRQFKVLRDARIYLMPREDGSKTVDVVVVTQDVISLGASGGYSSLKNFRLDLYDINILGYARQLQFSYFRNASESPHHGYEVTLREQNFRSTFIEAEVQYTNNYLRERSRVSLGRDFFTPEIKYAGGAEFYRTSEKFYFERYDTLEMPYKENNVDLWAGRSFEFRKRVNLILTTRLNTRNFIARPFVSSDSNSFFFDRTLLLGNVTIIKRNFFKSRRISGFGKTEDIPVGVSVGLLFGKEYSEFIDRPYLELDGAFRKYFTNVGYLSVSLAAGSYFKNKDSENGLLKISSLYFTELVKVRKLQLRQFVYFNYVRGLNRILDKTVSLEGKWRSDLNERPFGDQKMSVGVETVYFMPWYSYGFQFALYHRFDVNLLAVEGTLLSRSAIFPVIRVGMRTLNENLVLPTLSIEVGYYGHNRNYNSKWEIKLSTTLPNLFGTFQAFKPQITSFE